MWYLLRGGAFSLQEFAEDIADPSANILVVGRRGEVGRRDLGKDGDGFDGGDKVDVAMDRHLSIHERVFFHVFLVLHSSFSDNGGLVFSKTAPTPLPHLVSCKHRGFKIPWGVAAEVFSHAGVDN